LRGRVRAVRSHSSGTRELAAAGRAEASSEEDGRTADAEGAGPSSPYARGSVEQRVDLLDARLDRDELRAALDDEAGIEPVALVHLEREASEVAQALLPNLEQGLPLSSQLTRRRNDVFGGRL